QGLLPAYQQILGAVSKFTASLQRGTITAVVAAVRALAAIVLVASAAQTIYNTALGIYKAITTTIRIATIIWANAQLALNLAMMANPIGLIIVALIALAAIFVVLWMKSETFRSIVIGAWNAIKAAPSAV